MRNTLGKKWICLSGLVFCLACSDEIAHEGNMTPLSLAVTIENDLETKALVESTSFGEGERIGLFVQGASTVEYEGSTYQNVPYQSYGSSTSQTWQGATILLSSAMGRAFAYWPYSDGLPADYTKVPVDLTTQTDWLYSGWNVSLSNKQPNLTLTMNHALTAIEFDVKRGDYTGTAQLTGVTMSGAALGKTGKLNVSDGSWSEVATGMIGVSGLGIQLQTSPAMAVKLLAIPISGAERAFEARFTIDGKVFPISLGCTEDYAAGKKYMYTITLNGQGLSVGEVTVTGWTNSGISETIDAEIENI